MGQTHQVLIGRKAACSPRFWAGVARALLFVSLVSCSAMSSTGIEGWPRLEVREHYLPHAEMRTRCAKYVGFGATAYACMEVRFDLSRCDIYYSADFPPQAWVIEHERKHCAGFDHAGETTLRDALKAWRAK